MRLSRLTLGDCAFAIVVVFVLGGAFASGIAFFLWLLS